MRRREFIVTAIAGAGLVVAAPAVAKLAAAAPMCALESYGNPITDFQPMARDPNYFGILSSTFTGVDCWSRGALFTFGEKRWYYPWSNGQFRCIQRDETLTVRVHTSMLAD